MITESPHKTLADPEKEKGEKLADACSEDEKKNEESNEDKTVPNEQEKEEKKNNEVPAVLLKARIINGEFFDKLKNDETFPQEFCSKSLKSMNC